MNNTATSTTNGTGTSTGTPADDFTRIDHSQHIETLESDQTGKFYFLHPDLRIRKSWIGIIKEAGQEVKSDAFTTKGELFVWLKNDGVAPDRISTAAPNDVEGRLSALGQGKVHEYDRQKAVEFNQRIHAGIEIPMTPVTGSSNLVARGYDPVSRTMRIEFKGGAVYDYSAVPAECWSEFDAVCSDPNQSAGSWFNRVIKGGGYRFAAVTAPNLSPSAEPTVPIVGNSQHARPEQLSTLNSIATAKGVDADEECSKRFPGGFRVDHLSADDTDELIRHIQSLPDTTPRRTFFEPIASPVPVAKKVPPVSTFPEEPDWLNQDPSFLPLTGTATRVDENGDDWADTLGEDYKSARVVAELDPDDAPVFPAEMVTAIVRENNNITKHDVESVLAEFRSSVSIGKFAEEAFALVVTDINDKAGMKKAREMRIAAKKERVKFDNEGLTKQDPYLRRLQIYQGVRKHGRDLWQAIEKHLKTQEDFEKIENERKATELQIARVESLAQYEWMPGIDETNPLRLGYMTEPEWLGFCAHVKSAYDDKKERERLEQEQRKAEEEKLQRENERLQKVQERTKELVRLGLPFNGTSFVLEDLRVELLDIEHSSDDAFSHLVADLTPRALKIKEAELERARLETRMKTRVDRMAAIGLRWNGTEYRYEGFGITHRVPVEPVKEAPDEDFDTAFASWQSAIAIDKQNKVDEDARLKKLADEAEELAKAEAQRRLAPDKEKLNFYFNTVVHDAVTKMPPELVSEAAQDVVRRFYDEVTRVINEFAAEASRL
jgi:KTSC domain